jgi:hypothetical protein
MQFLDYSCFLTLSQKVSSTRRIIVFLSQNYFFAEDIKKSVLFIKFGNQSSLTFVHLLELWLESTALREQLWAVKPRYAFLAE